MAVGGLGSTLSTWSSAAPLGHGVVYFLLKPGRVKHLHAFMAFPLWMGFYLTVGSEFQTFFYCEVCSAYH